MGEAVGEFVTTVTGMLTVATFPKPTPPPFFFFAFFAFGALTDEDDRCEGVSPSGLEIKMDEGPGEVEEADEDANEEEERAEAPIENAFCASPWMGLESPWRSADFFGDGNGFVAVTCTTPTFNKSSSRVDSPPSYSARRRTVNGGRHRRTEHTPSAQDADDET